MTTSLYLRDEGLRRLGEIEDFDKIECVLRHRRTGTWLLDLPATTELAGEMTEGRGLIVERDGAVLLSGPLVTAKRKSDKGKRTLTVGGVTDTVYLERRLALPVPSGPPYTAAAYDDKSGNAETVLRHFVDRNLGPAATTARRLPAFTLQPDLARGTSVRGRARFPVLLELLDELAAAGGDLGFAVVQVGTGLQFQVTVPQDRTRTAVFSEELGNLGGYELTLTAAVGDYVIAAGGGEGTARTFVERGTASANDPRRRHELFRDRRDTTDLAELEQTITETLAETASSTSLSLSPIDTEAVRFGRDYALGDRVTVQVEGQDVVDVVREVTLTLTPDGGDVVTPAIGTPGAGAAVLPGLFDTLRRLGRRLSNLERR